MARTRVHVLYKNISIPNLPLSRTFIYNLTYGIWGIFSLDLEEVQPNERANNTPIPHEIYCYIGFGP